MNKLGFLSLALVVFALPAAAKEEALHFAGFGKVILYYQNPQPAHVVLLVSGDGGWGVTDRGLAKVLAAHGIPVVALNSLQYFWHGRTPEAASADSDRILRHYFAAWRKRGAIVIGYSFGADVLPFLLNRLPNDTLERIELVTFLGLGSRAEFEFHFTDWLGLARKSATPVRPEVEKLRGKKMLCFYGAEDEDALCGQLGTELVRPFPLAGGHRIGTRFEPIAEAILRE